MRPTAACILPKNEMDERLSWIRTRILPHALRTQGRADGLRVDFADAPKIRGLLDQLIKLEADCCSQMRLKRIPGEFAGELSLEIRGVDPSDPVFTKLAGGSAQGEDGRIAKRSKAAAYSVGLGSAAGFFVCCVLAQLLIWALGGVAVPMLLLDQPAVIGATSVLVALLIWYRLRRND